MPHQPDRRAWLGATAAGTVATSAMAGGAPTASSAIAAENRKPGTLDWQLTYARFDSGAKYRSSLIEGYATKTSVRPGQSVGFCLSVQKPGPVHIDIYRMGHYQGLGGRHMARLGPFEAKPQATPPVADMRLRQCRWTPATEFTVPADWPSGVYLGKLSAGHHRYQSYIVFIVTSDKPADILFQCSTNTWQAYNKWPETHSLYDNDRPDKKPLVSGVRATFDRPYAKYPQVVDHPLSLGSGEFLLWEFPFAHWLEQHGYDVRYCANEDVDTGGPDFIARSKVFLSVGHDEYWTRKQYDACLESVKRGARGCR